MSSPSSRTIGYALAFLLLAEKGYPQPAPTDVAAQRNRLATIVTQLTQLNELRNRIGAQESTITSALAEGGRLNDALPAQVAALAGSANSSGGRAAVGASGAGRGLAWYCSKADEHLPTLVALAKKLDAAADQFTAEVRNFPVDRDDSASRLVAYSTRVAAEMGQLNSQEFQSMAKDFKEIHTGFPAARAGYDAMVAGRDRLTRDATRLRALALMLQQSAATLEPMLPQFEEQQTGIKRTLTTLTVTVTDPDLRGEYMKRLTEVSAMPGPSPRAMTVDAARVRRDIFHAAAEKHLAAIDAAAAPFVAEARDCNILSNPAAFEGARLGAARLMHKAETTFKNAFADRLAKITVANDQLNQAMKLNEKNAEALEIKVKEINATIDNTPNPNGPNLTDAEKERRKPLFDYWQNALRETVSIKIGMQKEAEDIRRLLKGYQNQATATGQASGGLLGVVGSFSVTFAAAVATK